MTDPNKWVATTANVDELSSFNTSSISISNVKGSISTYIGIKFCITHAAVVYPPAFATVMTSFFSHYSFLALLMLIQGNQFHFQLNNIKNKYIWKTL